MSGNDQCARSSGDGEPCPYNFESQCGYIYDRGDWRLRVGLAILAIPDHTAGYSPWFSTTRYSGKCFRSYFGAGRSGRRVADVRDIGRGVRAQSQQPETNVVFASIVGEELISEGLGVGRKVGVGSAADVGRIAMVGTLTVGSLRDMVGTECAGEHVSLCESFARCLSRPEWLTLNRSLYCLIALRFDDWFFRYGLFQDYVMDVGSLKCSASEAAGAVGCLELPSPKLVGAVGCLCMFVLLGWLARRLVAVRWFRKKRYVRRWRAVSVRLEAMMRPVSRDRTQVLVTTTKRQTGICHTLSLWLEHVVLCLSRTVGVVATRALGSMTSLWTGVLWMKKRVSAVHGKGCEFKSLGDEGDRGFPVPLVECLGALRGLPVRIDADTGEVEVGAEGDEEELVPDVAEPSSSSKRPRMGPLPPEPEPPEGPVVVQDEDPVPVQITEERLRIHRNHGHQPYLPCCDVCQSARGRIPARRKKMKTHAGPGELQVDFGFFGRNIRFLLIVHVLSGYCAVLVLGPEDPVPHTSICKLLHEMGVGGLEVVCHGDQENLLEAVFRNAARDPTFPGRSMHWVPFPVNRPQAKGIVERRIGLVKESFWSIWLGLEVRVGEQLPLGSELFAEAMRYSVRMHNLFHCGKEQTTPLERLRGSTVQPVKTFEFGVVGFGKPQKQYKEHRGKRLVRAIYVGPHGANGSGVRVFVPMGKTKPRLEVFSSFRAREGEFDLSTLKLLKGDREDPERPILYEVPPDAPEPPADPPAEYPDGAIELPLGPPVPVGDVDMEEDAEPHPAMDLDLPDMDELFGNDDDQEMEVQEDSTDMALDWLNEHMLTCLFDGPDLRIATSQPLEGDDEWFDLSFGGQRIWVHVPSNAVCEVSGRKLEQSDLRAAMRLELEEIDAFKVATICTESTARSIATKRVHTTRWVLTLKPTAANPKRVRARLVVRDYAFGSTPMEEGIYSPTTSLEALRSVLAIHAARGGTLVSADVSVAFMQAPVRGSESIRFPKGMVDAQGQPLFARLHKAMNGLRVGPLSWYLEFTKTLRGEFGFEETADPTVHFRTEKDKSIMLVLVYVDDLLIYSENPATASLLCKSLAKKYKMKLTGSLKPQETGQLEFLGRVITRTTSDGPVFFGLKPGYLRSLGEEFGITNSKSRSGLGNLERHFKSKPSVPISRESYERYRRVLG